MSAKKTLEEKYGNTGLLRVHAIHLNLSRGMLPMKLNIDSE